MDVMALLDPVGAAIVLGGTLLATALGSGRREMAAATKAVIHLLCSPFDLERSRAEVARDVEAIRRDGVVRTSRCHSSDPEIARATDALIHDRSVLSLIAAHEDGQNQRRQLRTAAQRPILLAGEMAPVFGMAGTLFSLSQLQAPGALDAAMMASVGLAIVTTLYGLLLAHLAFLPLARMVERKGQREDADRQLLIDWLARQLASSCPPSAAPIRARLEQAA